MELRHLDKYYLLPKLLRHKDSDQDEGMIGDIRKVLIPNTIVECAVTRVRRSKAFRIEAIEATYVNALALCHTGNHLYQDGHSVYISRDSTNGLDQTQLEEMIRQYRSFKGLSIKAFIDKDRYIYDRDMPHLSYEVDDVKVGDHIIGMVVENTGDKLYLTLQNSKISGCIQQPLDILENELHGQRESRVFYRLGVATARVGPYNGGSLYSLEKMIADAGINQYASIDSKGDTHIHSFPCGESAFNFAKLRELQNIDWSEDSVVEGLKYEKGFIDDQGVPVNPDSNRALEFYNNP